MKRKRIQAKSVKTHRAFRNFRYIECDAFSKYLHDMSLRGWHFRKWKIGLVFVKGDPSDITYCVEVFPKGSEMDLKPENEAKEYADYCDIAGWKLIDGQRKFCIFQRRKTDAPPVVTEEERFENVCKAEWGRLAAEMAAPILLMALFWIRAWGREFSDWIFFVPNLWILLLSSLITILWLLQCVKTISWTIRGRRALLSGKSVSYKEQRLYRVMKWICVFIMEIGAIVLLAQNGMLQLGLLLAGTISFIIIFSLIILCLRPTREVNWMVQMAGSLILFLFIITAAVGIASGTGESVENKKALMQLPLIQSDYYERIDGKPGSAEYINQSSIFGSMLRGRVVWEDKNSESNALDYIVYRSKYDWVLDKIWKTETNRANYRDLKEEDPQLWKADELYSNMEGTRIYARYENSILQFSDDIPPSSDQIEKILEKLNLEKLD